MPTWICRWPRATPLLIAARTSFSSESNSFGMWKCRSRPLALATGEFDAAVANHGLVAPGQAHDELVRQGAFGSGAYGLRPDAGAAVGDVIGHRVVEQKRILRYQADATAQAGQTEAAHVA